MNLDGTLKLFRACPKDTPDIAWTFPYVAVRVRSATNGTFCVERIQRDQNGTYWQQTKRFEYDKRRAFADYRAGIQEVQQAYPDYEAY